jgi:hypothetical protein
MAVVIGALVRVSSQIIKKEFRFYLAKGYCIIASKNEEGDLDKMKYLLSSLDSYNKYMLRKIKFGIKNIYSDIMISSDAKNKDEIIKSIYQYLGEDRLKLATYLSTHYKVPETEQFLIKESFVQKLKTIGTFLVAAIPIVISMIQLEQKLGSLELLYGIYDPIELLMRTQEQTHFICIEHIRFPDALPSYQN